MVIILHACDGNSPHHYSTTYGFGSRGYQGVRSCYDLSSYSALACQKYAAFIYTQQVMTFTLKLAMISKNNYLTS
jgi:hypothetical protein